MTKVDTSASMSRDGHISEPSETGFQHLFAWYGGDVAVPTSKPEMMMRMSEASARQFRKVLEIHLRHRRRPQASETHSIAAEMFTPGLITNWLADLSRRVQGN